MLVSGENGAGSFGSCAIEIAEARGRFYIWSPQDEGREMTYVGDYEEVQ
jgi:hypothetical protein